MDMGASVLAKLKNKAQKSGKPLQHHLLVKLFGRHSRVAVTVACVCIAAFEVYVSVSCILFGVVKLGPMMLRM